VSELRQTSTPIDVFITDELRRRQPKTTDYLLEKLALQDLARQMSDHPAEVLPHLVDLAMELGGATSGGISLYEEQPAPGIFRWHHLRGKLERFNGVTTPRDFSPCGICLDRATLLLSRHPERVYTWLVDANIALAEVLLVPLYVTDRLPLGTLWIVAEDEGHFDSGHARVMTELAAFVGIAVRMLRTEQRLHEALEQQELLTKEMSHRVKNLFAITQSMIHTSARSATTPREMSQILAGRVQALTDAHGLIRRTFSSAGEVSQNAELGDVLRTIVRPHGGAVTPPERERFKIGGPLIRLGEHATNGIALVCHELATNAAKYGALRSEGGGIKVSWQQQCDRLDLVWEERGGPAIVAPPAKRGFGSVLAERTVVGQLGGALSYEWRPEGLIVTMSVPTESLRR
jgi:two-component sensor histidine kinase